MELDRPHLRTSSSTSSTNSELFICFASRLSSSSSMKISKSILSPGRARDPPVSLSTSLSRRLRTNGSIKGGQASPMFPTGGKKRGCAFENPEPSSPKVTCIGQVRVKTKKKAKQTRSLSRRRSGEVSFRKVEQAHDVLSNGEENVHGRAQRYVPSNSSTHFQQPECLPHRNQRWVHLPVTICEALRAFGAEFSCLFPCRSSCFSTNEREKEEKVNVVREEGNGQNSCGAVFARWFVALQDCEGRQGRRIELVVGGGEDERTEIRERTSMRSSRRHVFEDIEIKEDRIEMKGEGEGEGEEEEKSRVSICIPPKNALLLMRCRSDPMKMAALTNRFWESPAPKHEDEEEEDEEEEDPEEDEEVKKEKLQHSEVTNETKVDVAVEDFVSERRVSTEVTGDRDDGEKEANLGTEMQENEEEKLDEMPQNCGEVEEIQVMKHDVMKDEESEANFPPVEAHADQEVEENREDKPIQEMGEEEEESSRSSHSSSSRNLDKQNLENDDTEKETPEQLATETPLEEENEEKAESTREEETQEPALENSEQKETTTHQNSELEDTEYHQKEENDPEETAIGDEEEDHDQNLQVFAEKPDKTMIETAAKNEQESSTSSNVLPDCLLLMMCEPKLSMEVSKETWVCSTDFIRWLPERQTKKVNATDEPKKRVSKDSNPGHPSQESKTQKQKVKLQQQQQQHLLQPPRSSCSLPAAAAVSMATMIEQKLVNAVGYEPFVLTRCKSEPMRTAAAKLAPDSCFWNNRNLEPHRPATFGVGAAGVGF